MKMAFLCFRVNKKLKHADGRTDWFILGIYKKNEINMYN